ncbi:hypothetical protein H9S87_18945 (plasmid) [Bacillus pumilus]|uniref:hypothetical protein n=1 Tax=Bacillus pumilus TaxID=1408 RepID=UPI0016578D48|nr:hypothetical protein [Bacillus pumilus]QNP18252.1 hypothetical protein H9S87_18945 [Bacillus pumilus]
MSIELGAFYACDHVRPDGVTETNIMLVLEKRKNKFFEIESDFYVSETIELVDGKFDAMYTNDWLPQFLERKATPHEIEKFKRHRELYPDLESWKELFYEAFISKAALRKPV